ncbi:MAG: PHP domain-containing protein [Chloroflexota bacterium]
MPEYIELHAHSYYSLLDGTSSPEMLVQTASLLGMSALALTDHDNLYGAVRFAKVADAHGIKPIFGAELTLEDHTHLTVLVRNERGWANLCALITAGQHNAPKGHSSLPYDTLAQHADGLICLTGCKHGYIAEALMQGDTHNAQNMLTQLREWFGTDHVWVELQHHHLPRDDARNRYLVAFARLHRAGIVATNNVHYAHRREHRLQDVLTCIRHNTTLEDAGSRLRPNSEYYLKSGDELAHLFPTQALSNTLVIAEQCNFTLDYGLQDLPVFPTPQGITTENYLHRLCYNSPRFRYPERVESELQVIINAGLANYFLVVWDIVRYAREQGIRCQGRGSAANSLVAYLLGISPINPVAHVLCRNADKYTG